MTKILPEKLSQTFYNHMDNKQSIYCNFVTFHNKLNIYLLHPTNHYTQQTNYSTRYSTQSTQIPPQIFSAENPPLRPRPHLRHREPRRPSLPISRSRPRRAYLRACARSPRSPARSADRFFPRVLFNRDTPARMPFAEFTRRGPATSFREPRGGGGKAV